jgi:hypothetical protein
MNELDFELDTQQGRETNAPDLMRSVSLGEPNND